MSPHHRLVLLNGPPGAGKDTAAGMLRNRGGWIDWKLSAPLKGALAGLFEVSAADMEATKDVPRDDLLGKSWRQHQIWLSEEVMKPTYGHHVFAELMLAKMLMSPPGWFTVSDCGFQAEADYLLQAFGEERVLVIQIHREGRTFDNDSRQWVTAPNAMAVRNDCGFHSLAHDLHEALKLMGWHERPRPQVVS